MMSASLRPSVIWFENWKKSPSASVPSPYRPVLPGVLMLEVVVQACGLLVRRSLEPPPPLVVLKSARNVTYRSFVAPGETLTVEATCKELSREQSVFVAAGRVGDRETLKARVTLAHVELGARDPALRAVDQRLREGMAQRFQLMGDADVDVERGSA